MSNAVVYAGALFELACEDKVEQRILEELMGVRELMLQNPDYVRLLCARSIPTKERIEAARAAFSAVHPYLLNTLMILVEKGSGDDIADCALDYRKRFNEKNNVVDVTVHSAVELTAEQTQKLTEKLETQLSKKVLLSVKLEQGLIGGIRLELPGVLLDGTIKTRLDAIKAQLIKD